VAAGLAGPLADNYGADFGLSSGNYSAESSLYLAREHPHLASHCIEPPPTFLEKKAMDFVDLGDPQGGIRQDLWSKIKRAAWHPYDHRVRWKLSKSTREIYEGAKLLHSEFGLPVTRRCPLAKKIFTIHDIIGIRMLAETDKKFVSARIQFQEALSEGAYFACDSEYTAGDVTELVGASFGPQITSMSLGLDAVFKPTKNPKALEGWRVKLGLKPSERYVIAHTGEIVRKNLVSIIKVVDFLRKQSHPDLKLVFAAAPKNLREEFTHTVPAHIKWQEFVHFTGYITDEEFPILYSGAEFLLFLSLAEGFGLPPLEAMGCGLPVICSNMTSLPEVVGDACPLVDPNDIDGICQQASAILDSPSLRADLAARALTRASLFTWEKTGSNLISIWDRALKS